MRQYQTTVIETNQSLHGKRTIGLRVSDCLVTRAFALVLPFDGFTYVSAESMQTDDDVGSIGP